MIESHLEDGALDSLAADVRHGMELPLKEIAPKYFYDARGSELFEQITTLPEYYPTRCERALLNRHAPDIAEVSDAAALVELGSGTASKTRALLYAMAGAGPAAVLRTVRLLGERGARVRGAAGGAVPRGSGCTASSATSSRTSRRSRPARTG